MTVGLRLGGRLSAFKISPLAMSTTQSSVPGFVESQPRFSAKPSVEHVVAAAGSAVAFDIADDNLKAKIYLENVGDKAIKYKASTDRGDNPCTDGDFDGILAGGSAAEDGLGTSVSYALEDGIQEITLYNHSASNATVRVKVTNSDQPYKVS